MNASADIGTKAGSQKEYSIFLQDMGISYSVNGSFLVSGTPSFDGRWLICLSICLRDTEQILAKVLPLVKDYGIPFLLIKDQLQHNRINNHAFPAPLFGKALQIFTDSPEKVVDLAIQLTKATNAFSGVFIPGCIRLGSIVYGTYSTKNPDFDSKNPNSLPFRLSVDETPLPFPSFLIWKEKSIRRFLKGCYLPISLIRSSHKGNILKGLDLWQFKWAFIKQANVWAAEDFHGRTMRDRLLWQREVSNAVGDRVRIPKVLDVFDQDGYSYLITEYVNGQTLYELIKNKGIDKKDFKQLIGYYYQALSLVNNLHQLGYIHRDLTAKNILIENDRVYLTDFELVYWLGDTSKIPYDGGTRGYMSPQQKQNARPTLSEDVFALGALLYHILSGEHPNALISLDPDQRLEHLLTMQAPHPIKEAIIHCMAAEPNDRWSLGKLIDTIQPFLSTPTEQKLEKRRKTWRTIRTKLAYSGAVAAIAIATVVGLWLFSDEPNSRDNGFNRNYLNDLLVPILELSMPEDVRYLAGRRGDSLYFSTLRPGEILSLHLSSGNTRRRYLISNPAVRSGINTSNMLQADKFGITLFDGNARQIFEEKPDDTIKIHRVPELFTRAVRFSQNGISLRKFKSGTRDQYLYRYDLASDTTLDESRVTDPATDGGLVTVGMLDFDPETGLGAYVTQYANRITVLDTNMQIVITGHTVDTFSNYTLKSQIVQQGNGAKITNGGPAYQVNKAIALSKGNLYVNSYVKADNETTGQFRTSNVIDIYRFAGLPEYVGSYRLATEDKKRIRNIKIYGDSLIVLTPRILRIYRIEI